MARLTSTTSERELDRLLDNACEANDEQFERYRKEGTTSEHDLDIHKSRSQPWGICLKQGSDQMVLHVDKTEPTSWRSKIEEQRSRQKIAVFDTGSMENHLPLPAQRWLKDSSTNIRKNRVMATLMKGLQKSIAEKQKQLISNQAYSSSSSSDRDSIIRDFKQQNVRTTESICSEITTIHEMTKERDIQSKAAKLSPGSVTTIENVGLRHQGDEGVFAKPLKDQGRTVIKLYPLATPKHAKRHICEICLDTADRLCSGCLTMAYCGYKHFQIDEHHHKVCDLLRHLHESKKRVFFALKKEREFFNEKIRLKTIELIDKVKFIGLLGLYQENYQMSRGSFHTAIQLATGIYGGMESKVVSELLLLRVKTSIAQGKFKQAVREMNLVTGNDIKTLEIMRSPDSKADVYEVEGRLQMELGDLDTAIVWTAESIYQASKVNGPDSLLTARGFIQMGEVFRRIGQFQHAETNFIHALQNYLDWTLAILNQHYIFSDQREAYVVKEQPDFKKKFLKGIEDELTYKEINISVMQEAEVLHKLRVLLKILGTNKDQLYGKCLATLGVFTFILGFLDKSLTFLDDADTYLKLIVETDKDPAEKAFKKWQIKAKQKALHSKTSWKELRERKEYQDRQDEDVYILVVVARVQNSINLELDRQAKAPARLGLSIVPS